MYEIGIKNKLNICFTRNNKQIILEILDYQNLNRKKKNLISQENVYKIKVLLEGFITKVKNNMTNQQPIQKELLDSECVYIINLDFPNKIFWIGSKTQEEIMYTYLDIFDSLTFLSMLETFLYVIPFLITNINQLEIHNPEIKDPEIIPSNRRDNITQHSQPEIEPQNNVQQSNNQPGLQKSVDINKVVEICNIFIITDPDKLTPELVQELKNIVFEYSGIRIEVSDQTFINAISVIKDTINKHLKDETIFELAQYLSKNEYVSELYNMYMTATDKSEKLKYITAALFLKELIEVSMITAQTF